MKLPSDMDIENAQKLIAWLEPRINLLQGVMDGTHKIVPVEPTPAMIRIGNEWMPVVYKYTATPEGGLKVHAVMPRDPDFVNCVEVYRHMIETI